MINYKGKTWKCSECSYKYSGVVEPWKSPSFIKRFGISTNKCPRCSAVDSLTSDIPDEDKASVTIAESTDVQNKIDNLSPDYRVVGYETSTETIEEKTERILNKVSKYPLVKEAPEDTKNNLIQHYVSNSPDIEVTRPLRAVQPDIEIDMVKKDLENKKSKVISKYNANLALKENYDDTNN